MTAAGLFLALRGRRAEARPAGVRQAARAVALVLLLAGAAVPGTYAAEPIHVPARWKITLANAGLRTFGLDAPLARFAAQVHAESSWRPTAESPYAVGLAQFTPATAEWMADLYPHLRPAAPWDPEWSLRALVAYNHWLHERMGSFARPADRWAATLAGYVGGPGWVYREQRVAAAAGDPADRWWRGVARHCLRADWACRDSRAYPDKILCRLEPAYARAGWRGQPLEGACP